MSWHDAAACGQLVLLKRIPTENKGKQCADQRVTDLICIAERLVRVCERGVGIAEQPQSLRPTRQDC
jgi:hypothetical protein